MPSIWHVHLKYLGLTFSKNFTFIYHLKNTASKVKRACGAISNVMYSRFLEPKFKTFIYKCYVRPIIQYASAVWLNPTFTSSCQVEKIRLLERKIIRKTADIRRPIGSYKYIRNSLLYEKATIVRIDKYLTDINLKFFKSCRNSINRFIRGLVEPFNIGDKYYCPSFVYHLARDGLLYVRDKLLLYHKGTINPHSMVYNTDQ